MLRKYIIVTEWNSDTIIEVSVFPSNKKEPHYYNNGGGVTGLQYEIHDYSLEDAIKQIMPDAFFKEPEFDYEG